MRKRNCLLTFAGLLFSSVAFANITCDGESAIICIKTYSDRPSHYLKIKTNNFTSPAFCAETHPQDYLTLNNEDITEGVAIKALNLGKNFIELIQCDSRYCRHPIRLGKYHFTLSFNASTNQYTATPPRYRFNIENYGKECTPTFNNNLTN